MKNKWKTKKYFSVAVNLILEYWNISMYHQKDKNSHVKTNLTKIILKSFANASKTNQKLICYVVLYIL